MEHSTMHASQRKRIEAAIEFLLVTPPEAYKFEDFWTKYGNIKLDYIGNRKSSVVTTLFTAEPDTRPWIKYHDRKFGIGMLLILFGVAAILLKLFL